MDPKVIQHMALLMSVNCVRKTALDDYVEKGKLTSGEIKVLMEEVSDKLYTFLTYLLERSEDDKRLFLELMNRAYPDGWKQPEISEVFEHAVGLVKAQREEQLLGKASEVEQPEK